MSNSIGKLISTRQALSAGIAVGLYKGESPYIGENGHWYAYDDAQKAVVDTGINAQGDEAARLASELERAAAELARSGAETDRAAAEGLRISAEAMRAQAETGRVNAESLRVTAEKGRANVENIRVDAESSRAASEAERVANERARSSAETNRENAEGNRANAESQRATAENARASAETERATAESDRATSEGNRINAESSRATAEANRVTAEGNRVTAEGVRADAEAIRAASETARINAENARSLAEIARAAAESARETAEGLRETAKIESQAQTEALAAMTVGVATGAPGSNAAASLTVIDRHKHLALIVPRGDVGRSVLSILRTAGNGAAGTIDTYTVSYSDNTTSTFQVQNGRDGLGSGDMLASVYDADGDGIVDKALQLTGTVIQSQVTGLAEALAAKLNLSQKGAPSGVAELDSGGKVPSAQLPSFVDDVLEYETLESFPAAGESGKIYVATTTNVTYRWSGSGYIAIGSSLALGETEASAYRGDRGKTAYDHSQAAHQPPTQNLTEETAVADDDALAGYDESAEAARKFSLLSVYAYLKTKFDTLYTKYVHPTYTALASGLYKVTVDTTGHVSGASAVAKDDIVALGIPSQDTTYPAATSGANGLMSAADKSKLDGIEAGAQANPDISGKANALEVVPLSATANTDGTFYRGTTVPTGTTTLNYSGYLTATRVYGAYYSDYAEFFDVTDEVKPGDVVMLDIPTGRFKKCDADASPLAVGVVSDDYYICIGQREGQANVPIGLAGKLRAKVSGSCRAGDFLVSAKSGSARSLTPGEMPPPGALLGLALEDGKDELVTMLIKH